MSEGPDIDPVEVVVAEGNILGEGPVWDFRLECLYWLDIEARQLHSFNPATGATHCLELPSMPGSVQLTADSDQLLITVPEGLLHIRLSTGEASKVPIARKLPEGVRFNDGKTDPRGRIWAGTMHLEFEPGAAELICIQAPDQVEIACRNLTVANGLAWSADERLLYHIDSPRCSVRAFSYDADSGAIKAGQTVLEFEDDGTVPDGMTIDEEGMLWIAFFGGGCVKRFNPVSGAHLATINLPAKNVTSCCFGGKDFGDLYITSARIFLTPEELEAQPKSGSVFRVRPGVGGVAENVADIGI